WNFGGSPGPPAVLVGRSYYDHHQRWRSRAGPIAPARCFRPQRQRHGVGTSLPAANIAQHTGSGLALAAPPISGARSFGRTRTGPERVARARQHFGTKSKRTDRRAERE